MRGPGRSCTVKRGRKDDFAVRIHDIIFIEQLMK